MSCMCVQEQKTGPLFTDVATIKGLKSAATFGHETVSVTFAAFMFTQKIPAMTIAAQREKAATDFANETAAKISKTARKEREVKTLWGQSLWERYQELEKGFAFEPLKTEAAERK